MDNSIVLTFSSSPTDILNVDNISINEIKPSEPSISVNTSLSFHCNRHSRSLTISPHFIGYLFRNDGIRYTIRERIVIRKDDRFSHIWRHGIEFFSSKQRFISWIYNICWDKDNVVIMFENNTTRSNRYLLEKYWI